MNVRQFFGAAVCGAVLLGGVAQAEISDGVVRIGVLTDMTGPYSGITGSSSVLAAKMAAEDYVQETGSDLKIEVISADHQHKPDLGSSIARKWFDEQGVDMIVDVPNTAVGLAINHVTREKTRSLSIPVLAPRR